MPAQPAWFPRLASTLAELRELEDDYLDRLAVEKLFRVRERRARQLMAGLPALQVGNAIAVSRIALIARLESTASGDRFQWESARRTRVASALQKLRADAAARSVSLPAAQRHNHLLPEGVEFHPGELRIRFEDAVDLATKLFALGQAMAADWEGFKRVARGGTGRKSYSPEMKTGQAK